MSASLKNTNPTAKNIAIVATATFIVPPASFTAAMTSEPKNEAPFAKISSRVFRRNNL